MKVVVMHTTLGADPSPDDRDVLMQAGAVESALGELGYESVVRPLPENPFHLEDLCDTEKADVIFNLVESLSGDDSLCYLAAGVFERCGVRYTGARADVLEALADKVDVKFALREAGLPTAPWIDPFGYPPTPPGARAKLPARLIVKSARSHASKGISDASVIDAASPAQVKSSVRARMTSPEDHIFAEKYIEGREFNIAMLADPAAEDGVRVLPPAEIEFVGFGAGKPRIVGYAAKWEDDSFEARNTQRRFPSGGSDAELLVALSALSRRTWAALGLTGYARIDFRVDERGVPWILEANANPCLSLDAGFAAALAHDGFAFALAIRRIVEDAFRHSGGSVS